MGRGDGDVVTGGEGADRVGERRRAGTGSQPAGPDVDGSVLAPAYPPRFQEGRGQPVALMMVLGGMQAVLGLALVSNSVEIATSIWGEGEPNPWGRTAGEAHSGQVVFAGILVLAIAAWGITTAVGVPHPQPRPADLGLRLRLDGPALHRGVLPGDAPPRDRMAGARDPRPRPAQPAGNPSVVRRVRRLATLNVRPRPPSPSAGEVAGGRSAARRRRGGSGGHGVVIGGCRWGQWGWWGRCWRNSMAWRAGGRP